MIHHGNDLAGFDAAVQDAADTEAAGVVVVVQLGNLQLQRFVRAAAWCRRVFQNGLEQEDACRCSRRSHLVWQSRTGRKHRR